MSSSLEKIASLRKTLPDFEVEPEAYSQGILDPQIALNLLGSTWGETMGSDIVKPLLNSMTDVLEGVWEQGNFEEAWGKVEGMVEKAGPWIQLALTVVTAAVDIGRAFKELDSVTKYNNTIYRRRAAVSALREAYKKNPSIAFTGWLAPIPTAKENIGLKTVTRSIWNGRRKAVFTPTPHILQGIGGNAFELTPGMWPAWNPYELGPLKLPAAPKTKWSGYVLDNMQRFADLDSTMIAGQTAVLVDPAVNSSISIEHLEFAVKALDRIKENGGVYTGRGDEFFSWDKQRDAAQRTGLSAIIAAKKAMILNPKTSPLLGVDGGGATSPGVQLVKSFINGNGLGANPKPGPKGAKESLSNPAVPILLTGLGLFSAFALYTLYQDRKKADSEEQPV